MMASCGFSPMTSGKTNVAPNIATTCWAPSPTVRGQASRSSGRTPAPAGRGALSVGRVAVRVGRWWRAPRPVLPAAVGRAARAARADRLPPVGALLGRGPGLTPYGDDVLAGALVALVAAGSPDAAPLAR